jgi:hypothetical protein
LCAVAAVTTLAMRRVQIGSHVAATADPSRGDDTARRASCAAARFRCDTCLAANGGLGTRAALYLQSAARQGPPLPFRRCNQNRLVLSEIFEFKL